MAPHTTPPSGNRRHLTSANAGAFIQQSAGAVVLGARMPPGDCHLQHVVRGANLQSEAVGGRSTSPLAAREADKVAAPILNRDGRPATRSFDCRHTPSLAARRAVSYANPSQAHAATRLHGATV